MLTQHQNLNGLSNEYLQRNVPSIFAAQPWEGMSDKYQFIPTVNIVNRLREEGFIPSAARQSRTRIPGKQDFTKHYLRFTLPNLGKWMVNDSRPEMCLINSHDGSSGYYISAGVFRLICLNGMVVSEGFCPAYRTRHSGDVAGEVIDATYQILEDFPRISEQVNTFQNLTLTHDEQHALAESALLLRYESLDAAPRHPV